MNLLSFGERPEAVIGSEKSISASDHDNNSSIGGGWSKFNYYYYSSSTYTQELNQEISPFHLWISSTNNHQDRSAFIVTGGHSWYV
jgi:hypothetical protein